MATTDHDKVLDRREIAAALLRALERRHEVLDVIVESHDRAEAVAKLASLLDTTEFCAEAVLNLPFRRLTRAERKKIRNSTISTPSCSGRRRRVPSRPARTSACVRSRTAIPTRRCSSSGAPNSSETTATSGSRPSGSAARS